jgi:hypothetical protein
MLIIYMDTYKYAYISIRIYILLSVKNDLRFVKMWIEYADMLRIRFIYTFICINIYVFI